MQQKQRSKYLIAIYGWVLGISIFAGIIGYPLQIEPLQAILLGIATNLLSAAILFLLLNKFFLLDEWNLRDRVEVLLNKLEQQEKTSALSFFQTYQDKLDRMKSAKTIDLCGISCTEIIGTHRAELQECIQKGAIFRILLIDPDSSATEMAMLRSTGLTKDYYERRVNLALEDLQSIYQNDNSSSRKTNTTKNGTINVKLLPYCPSFGLTCLDVEKKSGVIFVELFSHRCPDKVLFELLPNRDGKWFSHFERQFQLMWDSDKARDWHP